MVGLLTILKSLLGSSSCHFLMQIVFLMNFSYVKGSTESIWNKRKMRCKPSLVKKLINCINLPASPVSSHQTSTTPRDWKNITSRAGLRSQCFADKPQPYLTSISFPTFMPISTRWPRNSRNPLVSDGYTSSKKKSKRERERLSESDVPVRILVSRAIHHLGLH